MKYTVDYFIEKFEAIPEDNWITRKHIDKEVGCCAMGFCGERPYHRTVEGDCLSFILKDKVVLINDGIDIHYNQSTPKQRILAALNDIKKGEK